MNFTNVFSELSSCQSRDDLKQFLLKYNFTFKFYNAKKEVDDQLVDIENEYVYVVKHPYLEKDTEPKKEVESNENLDMLDKFGRGMVFRLNCNVTPFEYKLMAVPLPFGDENFLDSHDLSKCVVTSLVDGTGFNVCKDPVSNLLFVSTRACGGYYPEGPINYFANKNYRYGKMFYEALEEHKLENTLLDMNSGYSLHLVMEHPNDIKVYPIEKPQLHLVNVFKIDGFNVSHQDVYEFQMDNTTNFILPLKLEVAGKDFIENMKKHSDSKITKGVKIFDPSTNTWSKRILSNNYERIKELLGNDTNIVFTLIKLRHQEGQYRKSLGGKPSPKEHKSVVHEFLEYFPEYSELYSAITTLCQMATSELFNSYLTVYTNKDDGLTISEKLTYVPREFNDLVRYIHDLYRTKRTEFEVKLKDCNTQEEKDNLVRPRTTIKDAMSYFNGMPPPLIFDRLRQFANRQQTMTDIFPARNVNTQHDEIGNNVLSQEYLNQDNDDPNKDKILDDYVELEVQ
jgi:hypothetical protein